MHVYLSVTYFVLLGIAIQLPRKLSTTEAYWLIFGAHINLPALEKIISKM